MKTCSHCKVEKPLDEFYTHANKAGGKTSWCKKCMAQAVAEKRKDPVQKELWKEYGRRSLLKTRYGITTDEYDNIVSLQNGVCAICKENTAGGRGRNSRLAVDHDHVTGKIRGLLCSMCNQGIGMFKDNPELLQKAFDYLYSTSSSKFSSNKSSSKSSNSTSSNSKSDGSNSSSKFPTSTPS